MWVLEKTNCSTSNRCKPLQQPPCALYGEVPIKRAGFAGEVVVGRQVHAAGDVVAVPLPNRAGARWRTLSSLVKSQAMKSRSRCDAPRSLQVEADDSDRAPVSIETSAVPRYPALPSDNYQLLSGSHDAVLRRTSVSIHNRCECPPIGGVLPAFEGQSQVRAAGWDRSAAARARDRALALGGGKGCGFGSGWGGCGIGVMG